MFSKECTLCFKTFTVKNQEDFATFFHKAKIGKYGFTARCKSCRHKVEVAQYRQKRKEYDQARYTPKSVLITCIVCGNLHKAQRDTFNTCSKECYKVKRRVLNRMQKAENAKAIKKAKELEAKKATRKNKEYTLEEKQKIAKLIEKEYSYKKIAKILKRTRQGITRIAADIKSGKVKIK